MALDLAHAVYAEFSRQEGFVQFTRRAPKKRVDQWQKMGIDPRGIDREIVEIMHRSKSQISRCRSHGLRRAERPGDRQADRRDGR